MTTSAREKDKSGRGKTLPVVFMLVSVMLGCARAPGGHFTDLESARAAAAKRGVPVFVDFFSPT